MFVDLIWDQPGDQHESYAGHQDPNALIIED